MGENTYNHKKNNIPKKPSTHTFALNICLNILFCIIVPALTIVTTEWIARGTLGPHESDLGFMLALKFNFLSFLASYLILLFLYIAIVVLTKKHTFGIVVIGLIGNLLGTATFFKLSYRNEPLLPWDLLQLGEFTRISSEIDLTIQPTMVITLIIFIALSVAGYFIAVPGGKSHNIATIAAGTAALLATLFMLFFVFLDSEMTKKIGIDEDMWMQDRYYRYNGALSGFLTNMQLLRIEKPNGYTEQAVVDIVNDITPTTATDSTNPDIIFLMAEGFWDMEELPGITYDRELMSNFNRLAQDAASGWAYSPSYGGGTCDVEFEALTGFSMEYLPAGSKPYQQYINSDKSSIAWFLKDKGYDTLAIHGYGSRFWNRDVVYPRLGIDTFISEEQMQDAHRRRGFISDMAMVDRIIEEQQARTSEDTSVFIHAVTMQNHTTYYPTAYPAEDMVQIIDNSAGLSEEIIEQVEDCATGIYEMDSALGYLTDYLSTVDRPTIVVFWGDHLNPMSDGYGIYEDTGYIDQGDTANPNMYKLPLLIWSNTENTAQDLGVLSTYNLAPKMLEIYDLDMPLYFEYLNEQQKDYTASSKGVMFYPDGSYTIETGPEQEKLLYNQSILQYDLLFGEEYLLSYENRQ